MTPFAIAGLQLYTSASRDNLPHLRAKLSQLMHLYPWVQMVVFSELAAHGPSPAKAEPLPGPTERAFQEMAAKHKLWLINGSTCELADDKVYNTCSVIDPDGKVVTRYRKMFPFRPYEEQIEGGDRFCVFDVPDAGRFGVSICYDMWFPETSRTLTAMGAEVILHPVMTTSIDRDVELAIARATAATNQCYVIDINGVGDGGNGRSVIVDPAGDIFHEALGGEQLMPVEVFFDRVRREREVGLRGLGQPLKSFRDCKTQFSVYHGDPEARRYLDTLGALSKPTRGSRAGLEKHNTLLPPPVDIAPLPEALLHKHVEPTS